VKGSRCEQLSAGLIQGVIPRPLAEVSALTWVVQNAVLSQCSIPLQDLDKEGSV
jgi:hypothetical protein